MKKFTSKFASKQRSLDSAQGAGVDSPEYNAHRGVKSFCESGAPGTSQGEEVLHLPVIVEAAESSPQAAASAANEIRTILSKEYYDRPHVQYNAIMLIRILANNPGKTFTKNLDAKFGTTVKELLRSTRDPSVQQIMRETLDALETEKAYDDNLLALMAMWRKEKGLPDRGGYAQYQSTQARNFAALANAQARMYPRGFGQAQPARPLTLPPPAELAGRVEEGRTTAKLLIQLIQSTPPAEVSTNELIKEFSQRGQAAQRSLEGYMNCNPPPDADTFQTLIETCEQLSLASSKHQRAILQARRTITSPTLTPNPEGTPNFSTYPPAQPRSAPLQPPADFNLPRTQSPFNVAPVQGTNLDQQAGLQRRTSGRQSLPPSNPYSEQHQNTNYSIPPLQEQQRLSDPFDDSNDMYNASGPPSPATPPARPVEQSFQPPAGPPPGHPSSQSVQQSPNSILNRKPIPTIAQPPQGSDPYTSDLYDDGSNLYEASPVAIRKAETGAEHTSNAPTRDPFYAAVAPSPSEATAPYYYTDTRTHSIVSPVSAERNSTYSAASYGDIASNNPFLPQSATTTNSGNANIWDSSPTKQAPAFSKNRTSNPFYSQAPAQAPSQAQPAQQEAPTLTPPKPQPQPPQPYRQPELSARESYVNRQNYAARGLMMSGASSSPPPQAQAQAGSGWRNRKWDA